MKLLFVFTVLLLAQMSKALTIEQQTRGGIEFCYIEHTKLDSSIKSDLEDAEKAVVRTTIIALKKSIRIMIEL